MKFVLFHTRGLFDLGFWGNFNCIGVLGKHENCGRWTSVGQGTKIVVL